MKLKISMRKKGKFADGTNKYILECYEDGKLVNTRTLPKPKVLWEKLSPDGNGDIPSLKDIDIDVKVPQKFSHDLLSEQEDTGKKRTLTDKELNYLFDLTK